MNMRVGGVVLVLVVVAVGGVLAGVNVNGGRTSRITKFSKGGQPGRGIMEQAHPRQQHERQMLYDFYGRRLRITPQECQSTSPRYPNTLGICMFNLECQEASGTVIGACVDRFLFGACCHIPDEVKRKEVLSSKDNPASQSLSSQGKDKPQKLPVILTFSPEDNAAHPPPPEGHFAPTPPRFPPRVQLPSKELLNLRGVAPEDKAGAEDGLEPSAVSLRKHTTLPPPIDPATLLPLTLETFSSVSDPLVERVGGGGDIVRGQDGEPLDLVEREALGKRPRPSSSLVPHKMTPMTSMTSMTTQEPPKISTFMYVGDDKVVEKVEDETLGPTQELQSNTENIWNVMMQLGDEGNKLQQKVGGSALPLPSLFAELVAGSGAEKTDKVGEEGDEVGVTSTGYPPFKVFGDVGVAGGDEDSEGEPTTEVVGTMRPWASSTYFVHTFKYPNFTEDQDDSTESVGPSSTTTTTTAATRQQEPSSTQPSIGKITTWSGIGTVVDKEELRDKIVKSTTVMRTPSTTTTSTTTPRPTTTSTTTTTTQKPRTTSTTTTTTTPKPSTTTKKYYTTRRTTTTAPKTTTTEVTTPGPTLKWRKPQPYTLPPHKRPSTTEKASEEEQKPEEKVDHDDQNGEIDTLEEDEILEELEEKIEKIEKPKKPVKKNNEKPSQPFSSASIILDEDMDTNLDDFVEQVVQGLAGSLDNLNIDNVILNQGEEVDDHDHSHINPPDSDHDLLQVISDPSFPPFPIIQDSPLTKPNVKINAQEKVEAAPTSTTTSTTTTTQKPLDWKKDCGVRTQQKSGRIVGGTASKFGRWPWQALVKEATWLGLFSKNKCGGVLIAPKYVLTAAHCQPGFLATLTVVLGEFDISSASEGGTNSVTKNVRRVIVHRDYNAQTFENDIALLELDSPVDFQSHVVPICLPDDDEAEFIGKKAFVTGWGRLKYGGGVPQILHEVDVPILNNDECQDMFHKSNHLKAIRDSFICAGYAEGFKDSCEGDSGGPLSIQRPNGQWVLAGTVSHGIKCAYPNLPGVYMRMTFYKPWIRRVTGMKQ